MAGRYAFLVDTYATETEKVLSVWSMAEDQDLDLRPRPGDRRGRTLREHMVHQCVSENGWFESMLGIRVTGAPLPPTETRAAFVQHYAEHARQRLLALRATDEPFWETVVPFFRVPRPRTWILVRRIAHTAHHRGQQTALLRALGRPLHSTYGPTADTGGLPANGPAVVYPYPDLPTLLQEEAGARRRQPLPPTTASSTATAVTERPDPLP
ncbi:MAG: DinB family protein [Planctomycetota bacterium]